MNSLPTRMEQRRRFRRYRRRGRLALVLVGGLVLFLVFAFGLAHAFDALTD
jgi:hypothetical protein